MGVFRPAARVTDPDGREWELYAYRLRLPERDGRGGGLDGDLGDARADLVVGLLDGVLRLPAALFGLVRLGLWDVPRAALAARRSDEWTIEAVTWQPHRTAYTWRTTSEYRGHVLARVEGQLARGEVPTPAHATYLGASG